MNQVKHLFECLGELERACPKILLADYDGTLTPIVMKPELAVLSAEMKEVLRQASEHYKVGIITGRALADIKSLIGLKGIYHAGNHGFEISGSDLELIKQEALRARPVISAICREMGVKLSHIKGALIEDKGLTASVHFRLVAKGDLRELNATFDEVVKPYLESGAIRITLGKKVLEVRPNVDWNKGKAVEWMLGVLGIPKGSAVYLGDDRTDEDAFSSLKEGITILVTETVKKSDARYFLRNVGEVKTLLERLIAAKK